MSHNPIYTGPLSITWEQKLEAIQALSGTANFFMRAPGDWGCSAKIDLKESKDASTISSVLGNGRTPQEAVENFWHKLTAIPPEAVLVLNALGDKAMRRYVRWNGFMWKDA